MSERMRGRVVIVSGAARGQGASHARLLCDEGATVVLADLLDDEGEETAQSIGERAAYRHLDVTRADDWDALVAWTEGHLGRVDGLVNNAGVTAYAGAAHCSTEEWNRVIAINQTGT